MTVRAEPPRDYRRRDGSTGRSRAPVGDWPYPPIEPRDGMLWHAVPPSSDWSWFGWVPWPRPGWRRFVHHLAAGVLMRYPLRDVAVFAWRHRRD